MQIVHMDHYIATAEEQRVVNDAFERHDITLDFLSPPAADLMSLPAGSGVYFIHARRGTEMLKVYVGKATDIRTRIGDYYRAFQVHCPNDRKLAMFQEWLGETDPGWLLSVSTLTAPPDRISAVESQWIDSLRPLVNGTRHDDTESRAAVEQAFKWFFRSYFERKVADA